MDNKKQKLLDDLKKVIVDVQSDVDVEKKKIAEIPRKSIAEIKSMNPEDQALHMKILMHLESRVEELNHLRGSPFFVKCELEYLDKDTELKEKKSFYFSKHQFIEKNIYSWVSPVASMRFENPGPVEYELPGEVIKKAILNKKDQYMIVDGKVVFFATESVDSPRDLIYQEHFSVKKEGFILPEIIAVMEKAQDAVIRAHHSGPFVISGPAGSGKTTLALHRVAYLIQSPDTAHLYPTDNVIVFVQDNGTKEYFSHLLPSLGIKNVNITTFFEWACMALGFDPVKDKILYVNRRGSSEQDKNQKEFERLEMISKKNIPAWIVTNKFIKKHLETGIDRIDLTIALMSYFEKHKSFEIKTKHRVVGHDGEIHNKTRKHVLNYSLAIFDEFQNYMPEQLKLFNSCINQNTRSVIYVGDMAQQVLSGTIKNWDSIGIKFSKEREVRLHKVYRNTKQILEYIRTLGYSIEIPEGIRDGVKVSEKKILNSISTDSGKEEVISYIKENKADTIGVIGKDESDIDYLKDHFKDNKKVHVITMAQSQGVEFDAVYLVGINSEMFSLKHLSGFPEAFIDEKKRIQKDLLYVALTRAISELHVIGQCTLSEIMK